MSHTQSITRNHRTAFVILIDGSGSMAEKTRYRGRETAKAEAVASITNDLLFELIERARRDDGVRDYYDIAVMSYSGDDRVCSLLPDGRTSVSVCELARLQPEIRKEVFEQRLPDGGICLREIPSPVWIHAEARGRTPMCEALRTARDFLRRWCSDPSHADSFPPVVFNITDGEATDARDEELAAVSDEIKRLGTRDGHVLLINIHLGGCEDSARLFFPTEDEARYPEHYASILYACSSTMPDTFNEAIREVKGIGSLPPFRGMSYNASAAELVTMLNIGSISVKRE